MRRWRITAAAFGLLVSACGGTVEPSVATAPPASPPEAVSATSTPALAVTAETTPAPALTAATVTTGHGTSLPVTSIRDKPDQSSEPTAGPTTTELSPLRSLSYVEVARVPFPIDLIPLPGTDLVVIASKDGRLWLFGDNGLHEEAFLDIGDRVKNRGEQGLLGMAFSPDYIDSGRFFLHYTDTGGNTVLAEYVGNAEGAEPESETVLLRIPQPAANHNGGTIVFGPDGYLYMGLGDGGAANDRFGNGQNDQTPLGALLRLDVSVQGVLSFPPGNPFPNPAIWAIGLRNPWRFTIDHPSGLVVIADVGQDRFEEVSVAPIGGPGLNYGWPITEGLHCFRPESGCDADGLTLPAVEVRHGDSGTCSITGGVVYRGTEIPELHGHYLFSDYCGGYLRSFPLDNPTTPPLDWTDQVGEAGLVVSFGADAAGEVYVMTAEGSVLRLVADRG